jgi:TonB family protein
LSQVNGNIEISVGDSSIFTVDIIDPVEISPKFPGGEDSLWCFIETNLDFEIINYKNCLGKVVVFFDIDIKGNVTNVKINPEILKQHEWLVKDSLIENEISRVIHLLPPWTPGALMDKPVPINYVLPIAIPYTDFKCNENTNHTVTYWKVDKNAQFFYKGRKETKESIEKYVGENGIWPSQDDCQGRVYIRVLIDKNGVLSDYKILRGLGDCRGFNEEALRLVRLMPRWKPAEINGNPVKSYTVIPISFSLK